MTNGMTKGIKGPSNTTMLYLITAVALMESHQMSQRQPMTSETVKEAASELVKCVQGKKNAVFEKTMRLNSGYKGVRFLFRPNLTAVTYCFHPVLQTSCLVVWWRGKGEEEPILTRISLEQWKPSLIYPDGRSFQPHLNTLNNWDSTEQVIKTSLSFIIQILGWTLKFRGKM